MRLYKRPLWCSTGGGVSQLPYNGAPVNTAGLDAGDGSFPYGAQQLGLGGDGGKSSGKYGNGGLPQGAQQGAQPYGPATGGGKPPCKNGNGGGFGAQPAGYGQGQLGAGQSAPYSNGAGGKESKYGGGGLTGFFGNGGYKG